MFIDELTEAGKTSIIAEIGTSHRGDRGRAFELIDSAAEAGADCVKTQIVYADEIVHQNTGLVKLPGGAVPLWERFRKLEVDRSFFEAMAQRCRERRVAFLASCFGPRSLADIQALGLEAVKIASPELNYLPLLQAVRDAGMDVILSAGVATLADIETALSLLRNPAPGGSRVVLMHCVTAYPAPPEEYNLRLVGTLGAALGLSVGVSDHSLDPVLVPALAVATGAVAIEKHFTLEQGGGGLDDPIALEPEDFRSMVNAVRVAEAGGAESGAWNGVQKLENRFGADRVEAVLGDGVKRLAPSEAPNYGRSNRSIMAISDIEPGEPIGSHNAAMLRSEKNLAPGLEPRHWSTIVGARAAGRIPNGAGIRWEHLLNRAPGKP